MYKKSINVELVRELLEYRPEVGGSCLVWKVDRGSNKVKGLRAGSTRGNNGYLSIGIDKTLYLAHRLVWAVVHGEDPKFILDHINRDKSDNRIENLRLCTNHQFDNRQNTTKYANNTSGVKGVSWYKPLGKWVANIRVNKVLIFLGYHSTIEAAAEARREAELKYFKFANP